MKTTKCNIYGFYIQRPRCLISAVSILFCTMANAQYVTVEGRGYTLCERIATHVNRLTDNGQALKFWRFMDKTPHPVWLYPDDQTYLIRELFSYPGFKRPAFREIKLEDVRKVIDLIGEVDKLGENSMPFGYSNSDESIELYLKNRMLGEVSDEMAANITRGSSLYKTFVEGKARVFILQDKKLSNNTVMQIEFNWWNKEPVSMRRVITNDLSKPLKRANFGLDSDSVGDALILVESNYYIVSSYAGEFEIQSISPAVDPHLCRISRRQLPPTLK